MKKIIEILIPTLVLLVAALGFYKWNDIAQLQTIATVRTQVPKEKNETARPDSITTPASNVKVISDKKVSTVVKQTSKNVFVDCLPGVWPGFRGNNRDNIAIINAPVVYQWGTSGPPELWGVDLGEGYAGAAVNNSRVYVLDYDLEKQVDVLRCFTLADGNEVWRLPYPAAVGKQHGVSRTIPAVNDKYVVTMGVLCKVTCTDAITGKMIWQHDLVKEYGTKVPEWYAAQCPIIDGNAAIIAPGSKALMVAFDLKTGNELWHVDNPDNWQMTHSSIMPAIINKEKLYIYCASGGVAGVSAKGILKFKTPDWIVHTSNIPTPVPVGDNMIFLSGGYGAGCAMLRLTPSGDGYKTSFDFKLKEKEFGAYQQTPIFFNGNIYGVIPDNQLVCMDLAGKVLWKSGRARFNWNSYVCVNGIIFLLTDKGELVAVAAKSDSYQELSRTNVMPEGKEFWAPIAVAGQRMLIRDLTRMKCLYIGDKKP